MVLIYHKEYIPLSAIQLIVTPKSNQKKKHNSTNFLYSFSAETFYNFFICPLTNKLMIYIMRKKQSYNKKKNKIQIY